MKKALLSASLLLITIGVIFLLASYNQRQTNQNQQPTRAPIVLKQSQPGEVSNKTQTEQAASNVYTNPEYGFQFTLPIDLRESKVMVEKDCYKNGVSSIYFLVPTSDKSGKYTVKNCSSGETYENYSAAFSVIVWGEDLYKREINSCNTNKDPWCPAGFCEENGKYVYQIGTNYPHSGAPELEKKYDGLIAEGCKYLKLVGSN